MKSELNLTLLNQVWEGILDKSLPHHQEEYNVEQFHCFASWIVIKNAQNNGYELTPTEENLLNGTSQIPKDSNLFKYYKNFYQKNGFKTSSF